MSHRMASAIKWHTRCTIQYNWPLTPGSDEEGKLAVSIRRHKKNCPVDAALPRRRSASRDNYNNNSSHTSKRPSPAPAGLLFFRSAALGIAAVQARHAVVHHDDRSGAALATEL